MKHRTKRKAARPAASKPDADLSAPALAAVFDAYPKPVKAKLLDLRRLIFETAKATRGVGALQETLKWGQPSYLTPETKSGSTIRIDQVKSAPHQYAVYSIARPIWSRPSGNCIRRSSAMAATAASC
jgi:hypothetical protein